MDSADIRECADFIYNNLRLKTFPISVKFLKQESDFPEKTKQPSAAMGKRISICQAVTMARNYGWTVGLTKADVICVPASVMFGFSNSPDPKKSLARLFCEVRFCQSEEKAAREIESMSRFENGEIYAVVLAPLQKSPFDPDIILFFGNPAQIMRLIQAWTYIKGERIQGHFGGKVECDEYLIAPYKKQTPCIAIPGAGDRIFSAVQDDEMVFSAPGQYLPDIVKGLKEAGSAIGVRYPATPYQNFEPDFPKAHKQLGKELGILP